MRRPYIPILMFIAFSYIITAPALLLSDLFSGTFNQYIRIAEVGVLLMIMVLSFHKMRMNNILLPLVMFFLIYGVRLLHDVLIEGILMIQRTPDYVLGYFFGLTLLPVILTRRLHYGFLWRLSQSWASLMDRGSERNVEMTTHDVAPLLSLVIPTRNRQEYAISLLQGVRACEAPELEVVVQDNSDDASLQDFVSSLKDQRIHYFHRSERLTMHQNFDFSIDNARGDYVCALGDDDGIIIPAALASLRRAKSSGADALLTEMYSYSWPGTIHWFWGEIGGPVISTRIYPGMREQLLNPSDALEELFSRGSVDGLGFLPRVYHGYVSRASLIALKEHCGTYFPGSSPDLANAVGLVPFVDTMLFDPSFTLISGHSPRSGGGQGAAGRHHGELEQVSHLPPKTLSNWDPAIPRFWSGTTIYAQTAIEAARAVGFSHAHTFNYAKVCVACLVYQPAKYRKHIQAALHATGHNWSNLLPLLAAEYAALTIRRSITFIRNFGFYYLRFRVLGRFDSIKDMMIRLSGGLDTP